MFCKVNHDVFNCNCPVLPEIEWKACVKKPITIQYREVKVKERINTREGSLYAYPDKDVILKGIEGEIYPCKISIFKKSFSF